MDHGEILFKKLNLMCTKIITMDIGVTKYVKKCLTQKDYSSNKNRTFGASINFTSKLTKQMHQNAQITFPRNHYGTLFHALIIYKTISIN